MKKIFVTGGSGFIGTNFVEDLYLHGFETFNYDKKPPLNQKGVTPYTQGDILELGCLASAVKDFRPDAIVHLAARCDLAGKTLEDYAANTKGVQNIISAAKSSGSVRRVIFASSRYVHTNEKQPAHDDEYSPFTMYGISKVEGERIVRSSDLEIPWIIARPTSIWGPWFDVPYKGFFNAVRRGLYIHPGGEKIYKSYGYVGNVVHQLRRLLMAPTHSVHGRVFYLADYQPIEVRELAETIRNCFNAPRVREVPVSVMRPLALIGDGLRKAGWYNPPLTSFRLSNLRSQMVYDLSRTSNIVGTLPFSPEAGVERTVEWMKHQP